MIVPFSEVCIGNSIVLNREAGVKVSTRTAEIIVGEVNGESIWKKVWVKQKQNVVIADPDGNGIVLTFWSLTVFSLINNMFDELWSEIADAPGEIFDVIEFKEEWEKEEKFDVEKYIKGNTDY